MHDFKYKNNELYCEGVKVSALAKKVSTPFYLYSYNTLVGHYQKLKAAFRSINPLICYSMKANSNLALCRALVKAGSGLDIVSGGELYKAHLSGCPAKKIVYASVGKTEGEIRQAVARGILFFNVESLSELELLNKVAKDIGTIASVANALGITQTSLIGQLAQAGKISPEQAGRLMGQVTDDPTPTPEDVEDAGLGQGMSDAAATAAAAAAVSEAATAQGLGVGEAAPGDAGTSGPSSSGPSSSGPSSGGGEGGQAP